jgi:hypothetical protein
MKHVETHHHFMCEKLSSGIVEIKYCNTKEQYVDFLAKNVP